MLACCFTRITAGFDITLMHLVRHYFKVNPIFSAKLRDNRSIPSILHQHAGLPSYDGIPSTYCTSGPQNDKISYTCVGHISSPLHPSLFHDPQFSSAFLYVWIHLENVGGGKKRPVPSSISHTITLSIKFEFWYIPLPHFRRCVFRSTAAVSLYSVLWSFQCCGFRPVRLPTGLGVSAGLRPIGVTV